jgi:hypothetical protein
LLCTTACRITFNDENFCILMKNQQMSAKTCGKEPKPQWNLNSKSDTDCQYQCRLTRFFRIS